MCDLRQPTRRDELCTGYAQCEPRHEQRHSHKWKRYQEKIAAPESIDSPHGRAGEHEVDCTEAEGREEGGSLAEAALYEDVGGVERDCVHAAELLPMCTNMSQRERKMAPRRVSDEAVLT